MKKYLSAIIMLAVVVASFGVTANPVKAATIITDCNGLLDIDNDLDGDYVLGNNIDCSGIADWEPLGTFTGKLDGAGNEIQHLTIVGFDNGNAFFGNLDGAKIYNLSFSSVSVETNFVGGVLATTATNGTKIVNVEVSGNIWSGALLSLTGGLVGVLNNSDIYYSSADMNIGGFETLGGLVGISENGSSINRSYSAGDIDDFVVGFGNGQPSNVGGLVGINDDSVITDSYSQVDINAIGDVAGGLVAINKGDSTIMNSYSSGLVSSADPTSLGGLVGLEQDNATTEDSYWDTQTSGQAASSGGTGKTTLEMQDMDTFVGWEFGEIWDYVINDYPFLEFYNDDQGVLTEVQQIPLRITDSSQAIYTFTPTYTGMHEYIMTSCGSGATALVDPNGEVGFTGLQVGNTYTCEIYLRNLTDVESNHLTIGPFSFVSGTTTGSKKINLNKLQPQIPKQQTPGLTSDQQISLPGLGVNSFLTRNLYFGLTGSDVKALQQYLNSNGFKVAETGPGSPGNETEYFGLLTRAAVIRYQKAKGISPAAGYVGPITRKFISGS